MMDKEIEDLKQVFVNTAETDPSTRENSDSTPSKEEHILTEDDIHEIQVDDDLQEPDPESLDYMEPENEEESD
jgi:hypothetical protein